MAERFIKHSDIDLWTESFGDSKNPAILLIMGIGGQGIIWPDRLCHVLADNGFFVIRYDSRDTGKSSSIDFSKNPYNLEDMAKDAIAVLDAYGIEKATVVGASMGGAIAQLLAAEYPLRVSHLVLIMSTPDLGVIVLAVIPMLFRALARFFLKLGPKRFDVPQPQKDVVHFFRSQIFFPLKSRKARLEAALNGLRIFSGGGIFDEQEFKELEERAMSRSDNKQGYVNHAKAILRSLKNGVDFHQIVQPTLIIHGQLDPVFAPEHGKALAKEIPQARIEIIPNMGHIIPEAMSERLAGLIAHHSKGS